MATPVRINVDKATVRQFFNPVVKDTDEINETLFNHRQTKRRLRIWPIAQASAFYVPNQFTDTLPTKNGHPYVRNVPDQELVNNKPGPEALGIVSSLIPGTYLDYLGIEFPIPQRMAGVEIDSDYD